MNRRVIVTNLPTDAESEDIEKLFAEYGTVRNVELRNLSDKLLGFVTMHSVKQAHEAALNLSMFEFQGNVISTVVET